MVPNTMPLSEIAEKEYPPLPGGAVYLNSGCCGRKPTSVSAAIARCQAGFDLNPCHVTFNDTSIQSQARAAAAALLSVPEQNILFGQSTTNILQIMLSSLLLNEGDELVVTDQEHGSLRTIARYLSEKRGIVVRTYKMPEYIEANRGGEFASEIFCRGILAQVNERTKLVAVSAIVSYTGFKPDMAELAVALDKRGVLLLADCAHGPGHIDCSQYFSAGNSGANLPLWVASGHKWLGGPNGTAFAYVRSDLRAKLQPVNLGDVYYEKLEANPEDLSRLEGMGTSDVCKMRGLTAALDLHSGIKDDAIGYQRELASYLRGRLESELAPDFRVANLFDRPQDSTSIVNFRFAKERLKVTNLQEYLLSEHKIAVQLDYLSLTPAFGMRISCHISNSRDDIDKLVEALKKVVIK
jgi:isopenicillin-N epimerase